MAGPSRAKNAGNHPRHVVLSPSLRVVARAVERTIRSTDVVFRSPGPIRFVVKIDGGREIDINAKMFSREAIAAVLALAPPDE